MTEDWGAPAAWRRRHAHFGALLPFDDGRPVVAMEYRPKLSPRWARLRELWVGLPPHPHIFDALEPIGHDGVLLRYAAIDWTAPRIYDDGQHTLRARALVCKAGLLLEAGAHESALALFDVVCTESPSDLDACEGRAQTLERLGRLGAAAEYRRFVVLANARADLRVRAARHWLDVHVL